MAVGVKLWVWRIWALKPVNAGSGFRVYSVMVFGAQVLKPGFIVKPLHQPFLFHKCFTWGVVCCYFFLPSLLLNMHL